MSGKVISRDHTYLGAWLLSIKGQAGGAVAVLDEVALLDAYGETVQRPAFRLGQQISRQCPSFRVLEELTKNHKYLCACRYSLRHPLSSEITLVLYRPMIYKISRLSG